jgi:hypothetical protein
MNTELVALAHALASINTQLSSLQGKELAQAPPHLQASILLALGDLDGWGKFTMEKWAETVDPETLAFVRIAAGEHSDNLEWGLTSLRARLRVRRKFQELHADDDE